MNELTHISGKSLLTTAATAIEFIEADVANWNNKRPSDLMKAVNHALTLAEDAANSGKPHECSYQTILAAAYILLLATAVSTAADTSSAPGVH